MTQCRAGQLWRACLGNSTKLEKEARKKQPHALTSPRAASLGGAERQPSVCRRVCCALSRDLCSKEGHGRSPLPASCFRAINTLNLLRSRLPTTLDTPSPLLPPAVSRPAPSAFAQKASSYTNSYSLHPFIMREVISLNGMKPPHAHAP